MLIFANLMPREFKVLANIENTSFKIASGPEVIKLFSCTTQLSMKFVLLINVKMPTFVFIFRINNWLWYFKPENSIDFGYFYIYEQFKFHAQLS